MVSSATSAGDAELVGRGQRDAADRDVLGAQRLAQPVGGGLGLDAQRVVGLHPQHEVHTALEVEAEADLLVGRIEREHRQRDYAQDD